MVHKKKTIESFGLVRADISSISNSIEHFKNILSALESRISTLDNQVLELRKAIDKNTSEIRIQYNYNINIQSKIENINKSVSNIFTTINSFKNNINKLISNNQQSSKDITINKNAIKKLFALSKNQSLKNKQLTSTLKRSQEEVKKLRSFINKRLKTITTKAIRKPYKRIAKKKTTPKRMLRKAKSPKKIVTETTKKTITEVKK